MDGRSVVRKGIQIVSSLDAMDVERVYRWISQESYWGAGIPREVFDRALSGSRCFAAVEGGETVGFARVVTDNATFAYLSDVFVAKERRGEGIGQRLIGAIMADPGLQGMRRWMLVTRDAHALYARHGFEPLANPTRCMERMNRAPYGQTRGGP